MNLDSLIKQGCPPWRPNSQASDLEVWHEYEIPLTGTFHMNGSCVLFTMVLESERGISVWAYVELPQGAANDSRDTLFESVDELNRWVDLQFSGREAVLAFVKDDMIADRWTRELVEDDLLSAVDSFVNSLIKNVEQVPDTATRVRAKIAGLDAARSELPERPELVEV